jgi:hypothetical protein
MAEILPRPGVEFNADYVRFRLDHDPDIWVYVRDVTGAKQVLNPPGATFYGDTNEHLAVLFEGLPKGWELIFDTSNDRPWLTFEAQYSGSGMFQANSKRSAAFRGESSSAMILKELQREQDVLFYSQGDVWIEGWAPVDAETATPLPGWEDPLTEDERLWLVNVFETVFPDIKQWADEKRWRPDWPSGEPTLQDLHRVDQGSACRALAALREKSSSPMVQEKALDIARRINCPVAMFQPPPVEKTTHEALNQKEMGWIDWMLRMGWYKSEEDAVKHIMRMRKRAGGGPLSEITYDFVRRFRLMDLPSWRRHA